MLLLMAATQGGWVLEIRVKSPTEQKNKKTSDLRFRNSIFAIPFTVLGFAKEAVEEDMIRA